MGYAARFAHNPFVRTVARRLLMTVPLLFFVTVLSFVLLSLAPGDAAREMLGERATPESLAALRDQLGLNQPLPEQYWRWLSNALHGDLGVSSATGQPVTDAVVQRLPVTLWVVLGTMIVMPVLGVALGLYSAVRGGALDRMLGLLSLVGYALPAFWLGSIMVAFFAVDLGWFPASGYVSPSDSVSDWIRSLILPVAALSIGGVAVFAKQTRDAMLDVLASEHVRLAWARGVPPRSIYLRYALRSISPLLLTLVGITTIGFLAATVFVETIFALPGIGAYVATGAQQQDVPVVQGTTVFFTLIVVVINLVTDLAYTALDPRVRTS
ncbi:ABC transporter permease [Conexibacter woesei]|uniref:Binding-protein-dependent transport systems inner membrane component n=1 Tax=Conexibacter woesei (strain DSM 14684 / CCUG 47730 / CIP 108061 / JCM 11494 / NBRC 100937 / ID131577) TaxID=469383 RepID=D3FCH5_CONWI|nr:ABC transporter permease [Conexibacter woesei]ADB49448.1 binding-protein-dependent transport systems inner membrane component [Conexibacter woesei DSM 14684]